MRILLAGIPGSGKTTLAKKISSEKGFCLVKTGEILRDLASQNTELAKQLKEEMSKGDLVSDNLVANIVKEKVTELDCGICLILDGYPRTKEQLEIFDPEFEKVFYLKISDEVAVRRLLNRHREDDTPEIIKRRLDVQRKELHPLLEYFKDRGILVEIDAEKEVDHVYKQIRGYLHNEPQS